MRAAEANLVARGVAAKDTAAMVAVVENAKLERLPGDATRLRAWLATAQAVLGADPASSS